MQSVYQWSRLFALWVCAWKLLSHGLHLLSTKYQFFHHEKGVHEKVLDFLHSSTGCSEISPIHIIKTRPYRRKTLCVVQLHHVQTEETHYKNVFLQLEDVPSKHELLLPYMVTAVTVLWPLVKCFWNTHHLSWEMFCNIFQQSHIWKCSCTKTHAVQHCFQVEACCYITEELRNAFTRNKLYVQ